MCCLYKMLCHPSTCVSVCLCIFFHVYRLPFCEPLCPSNCLPYLSSDLPTSTWLLWFSTWHIFTLVCFLASEFLTLSLIVIFSILLSIGLCAVMSFCSRCLVLVHVSAPYVIVGKLHIGHTFSFLITLQITENILISSKTTGLYSDHNFFSKFARPTSQFDLGIYTCRVSTFSVVSFSISRWFCLTGSLSFYFPLWILSPIFLLSLFKSFSCIFISFTDEVMTARHPNLRSGTLLIFLHLCLTLYPGD